jgi:ubiquinone/menaquinone biosynthesis C-methylase UbiE
MSFPNKQRVKKHYNDLGGRTYDIRYLHEQRSKYDAALILTLPRNEELIFDDGCGTGMLLKRLDTSGIGLDLTPALLIEAKKNLKTKCILVLGDAEHLPFRSQIFDIVYAVTLLQNIPHRLVCLNEIKRISKAGGRILVTALKAAFTIDAFENLLERANFKKREIVGDAGTNDWIAYTTN